MITIAFIVVLILWLFGLIPWLIHRQEKKDEEEEDAY